jgi:hypothetical protein
MSTRSRVRAVSRKAVLRVFIQGLLFEAGPVFILSHTRPQVRYLRGHCFDVGQSQNASSFF